MSADGATRGGVRPSFGSATTRSFLLVAGVALSAGLSACGTTDEASRMTLPPLETTTTTTTTTTTIPFERFYEVQPGDSLSAIAEAKGVTIVDILNANPQIGPEGSIQAGETIEIPAVSSVPAEVPSTDAESVPATEPEP